LRSDALFAERLLKLKKVSLLSNYPNAAAKLIEARGASPLMRERRSNHSSIMHYPGRTCKQRALPSWPKALRTTAKGNP
jgi:hypothetical protein